MPPGMLVGCSVLSGRCAFIHSNSASTRTSCLPFLDYAFVQSCAFLKNFSGKTLCMYTPCGGVFCHRCTQKVDILTVLIPTQQCHVVLVKASHTFSVALECRCHKLTFPFSPFGEILKAKAEQGEISMLAVVHQQQTAALGAGTLREPGVLS